MRKGEKQDTASTAAEEQPAASPTGASSCGIVSINGDGNTFSAHDDGHGDNNILILET